MNEQDLEIYTQINKGSIGIFEQPRGLTAVWGREAEQFLNGLITNDVAKLGDGEEMLAAFPNAKGRLLAVVRVRRDGDKYLFETEIETHQAVYNNLFRFTFAGDFFVEDMSEKFRYFELFGDDQGIAGIEVEKIIRFNGRGNNAYFISIDIADDLIADLGTSGAKIIGQEIYEVLRVERGMPKFGIDMDETTIVPELGDDLISYNKGCYIGQEIIARIHFRGHVAKQLTGLISESNMQIGDELLSVEEKPAGKITSTAFSPKLDKNIAMALVRYDFLANETELNVGAGMSKVIALPFV